MDIAVIVGNPKPRSRTLHVAHAVAEALGARLGGGIVLEEDLAGHAAHLFEWPSEALDSIAARVSDADLLIVASPTYKATYSGLLKSFLDRLPGSALAGVVAVPVLTMAAPEHALAVEGPFRSLLVELGASVPSRGLAFPTPRFEEAESIVSSWAEENVPVIARMFSGRAHS